MPYDKMRELKRVTDYYNGDPLQKRFSAIITGETNAGKTYILHTARYPIHIDSFDPGGTKCLEPWIRSKNRPDGQIIADTSFENEDPFKPTSFADWMKTTEIRLNTGYYNMFGTLCLDGLTTFGDAVMNNQLASKNRAGETPMHRRDYNPQKTMIVNYIRKLMNLPCDFILTGHLRQHEEIKSIDATSGIVRKEIWHRLHVTGQAVITIPLLFDELYVIKKKSEGRDGPIREMLIDSLGQYIARSRLKSNGKLGAVEEPDIKKLLKKVGLGWEDKPKLGGIEDGK
jgi:hypothetical protein